MKSALRVLLRNGEPLRSRKFPVAGIRRISRTSFAGLRKRRAHRSLFGQPAGDRPRAPFAVLANDTEGQLTCFQPKSADSYPSLTPACAQAQGFEREMAEQWGLHPEGHPWLKPIRFHKSYREGHDAWDRADGETIPLTRRDEFLFDARRRRSTKSPSGRSMPASSSRAFPFSMPRRDVFHLEISLGYQHRGVERALIGGPDKRTIPYMETLAGDTTIGHALAYCQAVEALAGCIRRPRAGPSRHRAGTGAAGQPYRRPRARSPATSAICRRRLTAAGSRRFPEPDGPDLRQPFGRGLVRPGGVGCSISTRPAEATGRATGRRLATTYRAVDLLWNSSRSAPALKTPGRCRARRRRNSDWSASRPERAASNATCARNFPQASYRFAQIPVSSYHTGNVFARAFVRWMEIQRSVAFISDQLQRAAGRAGARGQSAARAERAVVSLVEGWRGEICHVALTDAAGKFARYKVVDPSFHNWMGLALAMRGQQISDFPLCNKSFNLSYCGHDL